MEQVMLKIRYADIGDAETLGNIHAKSWQAAYRGIVPDEYLSGITPENRTIRFVQALSEGRENNALIFADEIPAGFICLGKCRDSDKDDTYGEIWGIYLLPDYWRKGIGTFALTWGIDELAIHHFSRATLWVLKENTGARQFYEKNGFLPDGTEKIINLGRALAECRYVKVIR
jgi:GNAT superfamily N-acetyltransferase